MDLVHPQIEHYAQIHCDPEPALLEELRIETQKTMQSPHMLSGHLQGRFLKEIAALIQASRILEIGTFTGYSALCFAEGMAPNGTIITLDINPGATTIAQKYFQRSPYAKQIKLIEGPALETLSTLDPVPPFDLVFIDADKENYSNYYAAVLPMVRPNGLIIVDNVLWSGRVLDPQSSTDKAIVAFNEFIRSDQRVGKIMLSMRDGVYLLRKK